jgi:hypothetical protein
MKKQATFGYPEEQLMSRTVAQAAEEAPKAGETPFVVGAKVKTIFGNRVGTVVSHDEVTGEMVVKLLNPKTGQFDQVTLPRNSVMVTAKPVRPTAPVVTPPPQTEAIQALTGAMKAAKKVEPTFQTALKEKRVGMAKAITAIRNNAALAPDEMAHQIAAVRKGAIEASFELPQTFTPAHIDELGRLIFASEVLKPQESMNAYMALMDLVSGTRIQPYPAKLLGKVFGQEFEKAIPSMGKDWSLLREVLDTLGIPRIVKASLDISWPLRQGIMMLSRPQFYQSMGDMTKALLSAKTSDELYRAILYDPLYGEGKGLLGKLAVADPSGMAGAEKTVEGYATRGGRLARWVERLPGIKQSQQAYATAGNEVRWRIARDTIAKWDRMGFKYGPKEADALATWLNIATGWGRIGPLEKVLPELANVLFAPRFWAANLERIPYGGYLIAKEPLLRGEVIRDFASFAAVNITLLSILKASGVADVEIDPRSTDFGRARIGATRIDLLGGMQPTIRQVAQIMAGHAKSASSGEVYRISKGTTLLRAIQGKLSPQAGFLVDVLTGKTFTSEDMALNPESVKAQAWNRLAPMAIADLVGAVQAQGPTGFIFGALSAAGGSVLTYQTPFDKQRALYDIIAKEKGYGTFDDMAAAIGTPKAGEIVKADQRVSDLQPEIEKYKTSRGGTANRSMTDVRNDYVGAQDKDDTAVGNGTMTRKAWLDNYKERQQNLGSAYAEYLKENPDMAAKLAETAKDLNPFALPVTATPDQVRAAYFKLFDAYKGPDQLISQEAWGKLDPEIDRFRTGLTPTQLTSLDENLAAGKSPLVQEYKADQQKLQPYWDMQDTLWTEFAAKNAKLAPFANVPYQDFLKNLGDQYVSEGKSADYANTNGYVKAFNKFLEARTQRYILQNPEIDALRNIWSYTEGVHSPAAARIYEARMRVKPRLIKPG